MSESLLPWISQYLIGVAEECGSNLLAAPRYTKRKKAQIIEFLTFPPDDKPAAIWATISDKWLTIPIKFTDDAVCTYLKLQGQRLTYSKTAIISISQFKPFFGRIPLRSDNRMSTNSYLAIECGSVVPIGSFGEAMFGSPKGIDSHPDLKLWAEGLRKDGGAGNILKNRKLERETQRKESVITKQPSAVPLKLSTDSNKLLIGRKPENMDSTSSSKANLPKGTWPLQFTKDREFQYCPDDVEQLLGKRKVYGLEDIIPSPHNFSERADAADSVPSSPERPVSDWAPTPQKKYAGTRQSAIVEIPETKSTPAARSTRTNEVLAQVGQTPVLDSSVASTSQPPAPTPAQRQKNVLPPSSPPGPPSSLSAVASETVILSEAIRMGDHVVNRKVPRPHSPLPPRVTDGLGEVLVPNSDTSLSHSQSQTQSQSQRGQDESKGRILDGSREANKDGGSQPRDGDCRGMKHGREDQGEKRGDGRARKRAKEVEHDEEGWRAPAFMRRARQSRGEESEKEGRREDGDRKMDGLIRGVLKLEGFCVDLDEVRVDRGGHAWLSRAEMEGVWRRIGEERERNR
ncbi:hypothetical protein BDQ17DRAFT_1545936 [Cyathus striatus]|nr:hypothetical protein BDQ17DRAFT_1545936 [Cyathus striatus]